MQPIGPKVKPIELQDRYQHPDHEWDDYRTARRGMRRKIRQHRRDQKEAFLKGKTR